jgi:hypothetical protein
LIAEVSLKTDVVFKILLGAIAVLLGVIAIRPMLFPDISHAQSSRSGSIYIEPGVTMLRAPDGSRQVLGKVLIDLTNGNVWGLPTTVQQPYPVDVTTSNPPTSVPFLLGKFDLSVLSR